MAVELAPEIAPTAEPVRVTIRVDVTEADIRAGLRGMTDWCPIALAMARAFDAPRGEIGYFPYVGKSVAHLPSGRSVRLPRAASQFVERFDAGAKVDPLSFTLSIVVAA